MTTDGPITEQEREEILRLYNLDNGRAAIAHMIGRSTSAVAVILKSFRDQGLIDLHKDQPISHCPTEEEIAARTAELRNSPSFKQRNQGKKSKIGGIRICTVVQTRVHRSEY